MKEKFKNFNLEMFMGTMFFLSAFIILWGNHWQTNLDYIMNLILGFVMSGLGVIRNDIKKQSEILEERIKGVDKQLDKMRGI